MAKSSMSKLDHWILPTYSDAIQAGDYSSIKREQHHKWGVRVIIPIHESGLLLVQHTESTQKPFWLFPGGGIEVNETITEAGIREVQEETGLNVKITSLAYIREALPGEIEFYVLASKYDGTVSLGYDPDKETKHIDQVLTDIKVASFKEINSYETFTLYPRTIQQRIVNDLLTELPKRMYIGAAI